MTVGEGVGAMLDGIGEHLEWRPDPAHPPLIIDLSAYFVEVLGE